MKTKKKLGIWMDHSNACLIEFSSEIKETETISSNYTFQDKGETLERSENIMHNKEQHKQNTYFKNIANVIRGFDEIILFGPTNAKMELHNLLKENHLYDSIKIEVQNTDKMSDKDQHTFVRNHFKKFAVYNFEL
ncbi:hypothetical protein [Flavobacterium sangjuense]|uniref:Translational machinery protein n=1 Tax=Flavobacterium sangjuense TaxID=2518177 RepID=A0A4P7PUA6_9FLAO|nr:hypothetical protein [Flavobacterium sangjuense]QBZ98306.1 hypothetical protein GS03_01811 [Flavobacterium sangjuense]